MKARVKKIFSRVEKELDLIVIQTSTEPYVDRTFFYVTGLTKGIMEASTALLYPDGSVRILTSKLEADTARTSGLPVMVVKSKEDRSNKVRRLLRGARRIGINSAELTHKAYLDIQKNAPEAELLDVSNAIMSARLIKDSRELEYISKACQIVSEVAEEIVHFLKPGVREYEIGAEIEYLMSRKGSEGAFFPTISASGPNSALPHYSVGDRKIKEGDLIVLDFGATYNKYGSDITRTYVVGKATKKKRAMHRTVLRAQLKAMSALGNGCSGGEVHKTAERYINRTQFKGRFIHGIGHSLGLAAHDGASLHPSFNLTLCENMVFTIEPGVYLRGYGGVRIEDDVVITKDGYRPLTTASRDLIEV